MNLRRTLLKSAIGKSKLSNQETLCPLCKGYVCDQDYKLKRASVHYSCETLLLPPEIRCGCARDDRKGNFALRGKMWRRGIVAYQSVHRQSAADEQIAMDCHKIRSKEESGYPT